MAEIHVQKKKKPVWPWVLGIILAVLLIIFFSSPFSDSGVPLPLTAKEEAILPVSPDVYEFIHFAENISPEQEDYSLPQYTSEALQKMALAISALVQPKNVHEARVSSFVIRAWNIGDQITMMDFTSANEDSLKYICLEAAEILEIIQEEAFPGLYEEALNLRMSAEMLDSAILLLGREEAFENFFRQTASVLRSMAKKMRNN
ncbi:MAG: hypothetical protein H0X62_06375 [Bacteroidetes bacterium]|nr:hypothetical protein [Bacteroidota bacterium]